ncbi:MAG: hypothetical protein M0R80_15645 [Proteobacteria bacterium]|jgi:hypothetical protein|nr:hypothetical protein [Pseudomonadota bacterium]
MGRRDRKRKVERAGRPVERVAGPARVAAIFARDGRHDAAIFAVGALLVGAFYLVLKSFSLNACAGDEHIYLYQAKLIADGFVPYRDFSMAHPPFQALLTAAIFEIAGYHFTLGRLLPVIVTLAGGAGVAWMARRELGAIAGIAAMALALLAYEPLRASSHFTGVETAVTLLTFAWLVARKDRMVVCAALCVCAVATRLYAIPGVAALVVVALLRDPRRGARLALFGAAFGAAAFVALGLWAGFGDLVHNVFAYHAEKTAMADSELANMRWSVLFHNAVPAALFALSLPAMIGAVAAAWPATRGERSILKRFRAAAALSRVGLPLAGAFAAILMLAILLSMDRVWMYYFVPSFPFAALAGAWLVADGVRGAVRLLRARGRLRAAGISRGAAVFAGIALAALGATLAFGHLLERTLAYWEEESAKPAPDRDRTYHWRDGALPGFANRAVRALLWDDERVIGERTSSFTYYLWHESRTLDIADEAVAEILARTADGDEIFGDSGTVPLLALLSGRDIASREVDTNIQRYRSGNADPRELVARIDAPATRIVFLRPRFGVAGLAALQALLKEKYAPVRTFRTREGQLFQMFERRAGR